MFGEKTGNLLIHGTGHLGKAAERNRLGRAAYRCRCSFAGRQRRARGGNAGRTSTPTSAVAGPRGGVVQLKLLGSVTRPPRPRRRVPRSTASGQGAAALIGIATISTSLSGPAPWRMGRPDCQ